MRQLGIPALALEEIAKVDPTVMSFSLRFQREEPTFSVYDRAEIRHCDLEVRDYVQISHDGNDAMRIAATIEKIGRVAANSSAAVIAHVIARTDLGQRRQSAGARW